MNRSCKFFCLFLGLIFVFALSSEKARAQGVKRVVVIKVDGLPGDLVDEYVKRRDPATGKSHLPWFEEVFYKKGTRLANFYSRGMSLSGPAWSLLDTGQHLQIKGNVEYDRLTMYPYDYLNFFPFYVDYGLRKRADMLAVEILDQLKVPLFYDSFDYERRYVSYQLLQRGNQWEVIGSSFVNLFPREPKELLGEWAVGFDFLNMTINQTERDIISKVANRPEIDYFDLYTPHFDHVAHNNSTARSQSEALRELDLTVGRIWTAIQASDRAAETALIVVSDHGFNSKDKVYSQGFNIVRLLASAAGGGHHVITKRRLMMDYTVKSLYPFVPLITTESKESYYLKGKSGYPTALVDFDGNERSSIHLRNSDLNVLHILLRELQKDKLSPAVRRAATDAFFAGIDRRRAAWQSELEGLGEEVAALRRWIAARKPIIEAQNEADLPPDGGRRGLDKEMRRQLALYNHAVREEREYGEYMRIASNLLALDRANFNPKKMRAEDYIAKTAMGERNTIYQMQNYVVGLSPQGLMANEAGEIDYRKSFKRIDYPALLQSQTVRNNVQPAVGNRPIDFVTTRIPLAEMRAAFAADEMPTEDPVWLYGGADKQTLILTRKDADGKQNFRYLPVAHLRQEADGSFWFQRKEWDAGFPLKYFEDAALDTFGADRRAWLGAWHTELDWMRATHKTFYSAAIVNLNEQLDEHPLKGFETEANVSPDDLLIHRFRQRQRRLTETDLLILASNHWNFDVRGFNPGGNHGSFFRISSNSALMLAGGDKTGIPRGLTVEEPYDSLSFVPTVMRLMGKTDEQNEPVPELRARGFRRFPGRVVRELTDAANR